MDTDAILGKITEYCKARTEMDETLKKAMTKVANGTATYAEARSVAAAQGKILEDAFRRYLPEALTDGYLYREYAEKLIIKPVEQSVKVIDQAAEDIQAMLNKSAGIGINPIVPDLNTDQLNGIVTGIVNENFQNGKELFFDQIGNLLEGHVDDFVHDNADFQYQAGLEATIERTVSRNCCSWCAKMAGRYKYSDVADRGNDVWRRHNNCHCEILFNPADGSKKRQNVHTKRWTDGEKADRIALSEAPEPERPIDRPMANGPRRGALQHISAEEERQIRRDAEDLGIPQDVLRFNQGSSTSFNDQGWINIRGDIFPADYAVNPDSILNARCALAHEYYGHMKHSPSRFEIGDWRDEFEASYRAALDTPNLTEGERRLLMIDAFDRAKEANVPVVLNKVARRVIYGIE